MTNFDPELRELLHQRADLLSRLKLLPYDGTPEIKSKGEEKYLYIRKRIGSRLTSEYVGLYDETTYQLLLRNNRERREINKALRGVERQLASHGYTDAALPPRVILNIDFARANMKSNIYDQAVLEGIATTFPQTEDIIENGEVNGVRASDVQKILNLKHAWQFILDPDVLNCETDYYVLCHIAQLTNEGFMERGGRIRGVPVTIGGTTYVPPLPIELDVKDRIRSIIHNEDEPINTAIELCLYCMKAQIFNDGNKRSAVIFANHYLISHGEGMMVIPKAEVPEFKQLLIAYYEGRDHGEIREFMRNKCWRMF